MLRRLVRPRPGALPLAAGFPVVRPAAAAASTVVSRGLAGGPARQEDEECGAVMLQPRARGSPPPSAPSAAKELTKVGKEKPADAPRTGSKPEISAHVGVALELVRQGKAAEALKALRRLDGLPPPFALPPDTATYSIFMGAAAKVGDAQATLGLLAEMRARGLSISPYCYNHALYACAARPSGTAGGGGGYLAEARALFNEMLEKGPKPTLINCNTFLLVLARHGQVAEARALLESMAARGTRPNVVSYNRALAAGAAAGAWPQVQGLLRAMEAEGGVAPDVVSYNTAISTLQQSAAGAVVAEEGGAAALGLALLEEMQSRGLAPDTTTYNTLVDVCCKGGRLDVARGLLAAMKAGGRAPDKWTYHTLAQGYLRERRFEEAWAVLEQMQGKEKGKGRHTDVLTERLVLTALSGLGRDAEVERRALQLLRAQSGRAWPSEASGGSEQRGEAYRGGPDALKVALQAMVGAGRTRDGIALVRRLEEKAAEAGLRWALLTADCFVSVVKSCRLREDLEGGQALLGEAERRGVPITNALVLPLVKLAGQKLEWRSVLALVELLEKSPHGALDLDLHNARLRALASLGDAAGCRAALAAMRAQGVEPNGDSFSWALRAEQAGGVANSGGIRRMLQEVWAGTTVPTQKLVLAQMAALRSVGDWRSVLALLDRVAKGERPGVRVTTVMANQALAALAQQTQWAASLDLIGAMAGGGLGGGAPPDAVTYLHEIVALGQRGRWKEAVALLHRVREGALGPGVAPQEKMYTAAAAACARAGRLAEAQEVHALRGADGFPPTLRSLNSLLQAHARVGDVEEAMAVLARIEAETGEAPDVVSYHSLIQAHRERGTPLLDADGVLGVYRRLLGGRENGGLEPDAVTYTALIAACVPAGQWPVALYLHAEAQFIMGGEGRVLSKADRDARRLVLRGLLTALEELGVDGLFSSRVYGAASRSWRGCISHWARERDGGTAVNLHNFSRPMAKAALAQVLERDFVARFAEVAGAHDGGFPPADGRSIRPLVIIVGRGRHSLHGEGLLKEEVQQFLASLDPPIHAVAPPHNEGRLVVSAGQLQAYVEAHASRRRGSRKGTKAASGGEKEEGNEAAVVGFGLSGM